MPNQYYIRSRHRPPFAFDIASDDPAEDMKIVYFIRLIRILVKEYGLDGVTVCFAFNALTVLPRLGTNVISVLVGEEQCRIPAYTDKVRAVIKCHGLVPTYVPRRSPLRLAQIEFAEFLRNIAAYTPNGWRYLFSARVRARCHLIPVGYGLPPMTAPEPFDERPHLISFLGSLPRPDAASSLRRAIGTPKVYCRAALVSALKRLQHVYQPGEVMLSLTGSFQESLEDAGRHYWQLLANTRICVAPRGTTHETWRVLEGLQFGCVVIADRLPPHPFYDNSPIIQIADWRNLPGLVERLLIDPEQLRALSERSLRYWHDVLSEAAQAASCAEALGLTLRASQRVAA